jgi:hypothetical protein
MKMMKKIIPKTNAINIIISKFVKKKITIYIYILKKIKNNKKITKINKKKKKHERIG